MIFILCFISVISIGAMIPIITEIIRNTLLLQASNCVIYRVSVAVIVVSEYTKGKWHIRKEWVTERRSLQAFFTDMIFF